MYSVSAAFHAAALAGAEQRIILRFSDAVLDGNDVPVHGGIRLTEPFCAQDELTIGLCPSASLTVSLANVNGMLDAFAFGEFKAYLGVKVASGEYTPVSDAIVTLPINSMFSVSAHATAPYVRINGTGATDQPAFVPQAIMILDNYVYVVSSLGEYFRYSLFTGITWDELTGEIWVDQESKTWNGYVSLLENGEAYAIDTQYSGNTWDSLAGETWEDQEYAVWGDPPSATTLEVKGAWYAANNKSAIFASNMLREYYLDGTYEVYEMCPLGVFHADRPATLRKERISFTAYDNMDKLDADVTEWFAALSYPITLASIFTGLCAQVGITTTTTTFLNSAHSYSSAPFTSSSLTGRALMKFIAEAACSIARFDRDGALRLDWFSTVTQTIPERVETAIAIAEYSVAAIDKLQVQAETTDIGVVIGTGTNAYVLLASPLIVGESDAEIRAFATPIYNRLTAYGAFTPISVTAVGDWSYQAGDIVSVVADGTTYSLPIYTQVVTWNGACRSTLSSTGSALRTVNAVTNREAFESAQKRLLIKKDIDGLTAEVVTKSKVVQSINLSSEGLKILASLLQIEGIVTANTNFKILLDGSMEAKNGKFSGTLDAVRGSFVSLSAIYDEATGTAIQFQERVIGGDGYRGLFFLTTNDEFIATDTYGVTHFRNATAGFEFDENTPVTIDEDLWVGNNVSAASFTDRTPAYDGDALSDLSKAKSDTKGNIDHATLPKIARKRIRRLRSVDGRIVETEEEGRDLGAMVSVLTKAVQQLTALSERQQKQINKLRAGKQPKDAV